MKRNFPCEIFRFTYILSCVIYFKGVKLEKEFSNLNYKEKNEWLFREQKQTLDMFLKRNAITKEQYNKSLGDLIKYY